MTPSTNPTLYCVECEEECKPILQTEEAYPGHYVTIFLSGCCHEEIVGWNGRPIPYEILRRKFNEIKSYEI
jgi:hypothetical protein